MMDARIVRMGTTTKQARALAIGRTIIELEEELRPLQQKLADLKREHAMLFDEPPPPPPSEPPTTGTTWRTLQRGSMSVRVLEILACGREVSVREIGEQLGEHVHQSLLSCLVALHQSGRIVRLAKGVYALAVTSTNGRPLLETRA